MLTIWKNTIFGYTFAPAKNQDPMQDLKDAISGIIPEFTNSTLSMNGRRFLKDIHIIEINTSYINVIDMFISVNNIFRNYPQYTLIEIDIVPGKGGMICNIYIKENANHKKQQNVNS